MQPLALIVGASGIVGRAALEYFSALPGWRAIGLSRRAPDLDGVEHISVDLQDGLACERVTAQLSGVTHVVYAALYEKPGLLSGWLEQDQMQTNLRMLQNLMQPLQRHARQLQHVSLLQGTKAYGAHVGLMRVPGKESEPRVEHENFYWLQEDWLKAERANANWSLTVWRPPLIVGHAFGAPMNVLAAIGLFGSLAAADPKAATNGFGWPGGVCGPIDAVDVRLLARAFGWAVGADATGSGRPSWASEDQVNPAAADQTFNVTNGDVFVPSVVWPTLAGCFGLAPGPDVPQRLQDTLPGQSAVWDRLVVEHNLLAPNLRDFAGDSLIYADLFFNAGGTSPMPSPLLSSIKLRKAGFAECIDSEQMLVEWLNRLQEQHVLPPPLV